MQNKEQDSIIDTIKDFNWKKIATWTTIISLTMIAYYGLGAIVHWKEIKKLK